jgi:adenine-specific DNA-methyltransferase
MKEFPILRIENLLCKQKVETHGRASLLYYTDSNGDIRLTSKIKRDILRSCIYGVDIDAQAVEVTKMSLSLKALENTTHYEVHNEVTLFHVCVLPPLEENVKCGNSLVGTDFYNEKDLSLFSMESLRKLNAFDWTNEFPELSAGNGRDRSKGFDCVIGNPPYVRQEILGEEFKKYAQTKYKSYAGTADLYVYFMEKSLHLLNSDGIYSIIVANKWMRANYGEPLRKFIKEKRIFEIIDFGDLPVFKGATTYPCIIKINNNKAENFQACMIKSLEFASLNEEVKKYSYDVNVKSLDNKGWSLSNNKESALLDKIKKAGIPLGEYVEGKIYYGIKTGLNEAFVIDEETKNRLIKEDAKSKEVIKPFLVGREIKRYKVPKAAKYLLFIPWHFPLHKDKSVTGASKKAESAFKTSYPAIYNHLLKYKKDLENRNKAETGIRYEWYALQRCANTYYEEFEKEKIIYAEISIKGAFAMDSFYNFSDTTSFIIPINSKYLLGILNSSLFSFAFKKASSEIRGGFLRWKGQYMSEIPIPNSPNPATKEKLTSLVEQMLEAQKPAAGTLTDNDKKLLQQKSDMIDRQIDKLVYELYGLTEEEISLLSEL